MSTANAPARPAPANGGPAANEEEGFTLRKLWSIAQQFLLMWLVMQLAGKFFGSKTPPSDSAVPSTTGVPGDIPQAQITNPLELPPKQATLAWPLGITLSMHVYLSTSSTGDVFSPSSKTGDSHLPNFVWENITFGDWNDIRTVDYMIDLPESVQHNASLWADVILVRDGASPDPYSASYHPKAVHHVRKLLTAYLPKLKVRKVKNLLSNEDGTEDEADEQPDIIASHWHPNLTLALVSDTQVVPTTQLPAPVAQHVHLLPERDQTGTQGFYMPIIFPNDFWHLRSQYIEINETTPSLPLQITFQPMSYWKFQIFATMIQGFNEAEKQQGGGSGGELDEVKRMLVETNPYFLALTGIVTLLHMVFEMLAFSSDVSHWRQKQELVGVSIVTNVVVQIIILLYLIDNNEQTSWMILMSSGVGVLIEAWKITKAVDIRLAPAPPGSMLPYKLDIRDKHVLSEDEKKTQEYDKLAFRYVTWVTIPCLAAYTVYSLLYETHRGWYSFVISTLTSFVYMFGFSVAHMPMKSMIYKSLSTVVDDLFAFCIKMPFLHRLACFRDDVVFVVFLYQRWIYRIDPKRVNEYGQVLASEVDAIETEKAKEGTESKKNK
ncbi:cleft lip and palate associated transmembrane protein [Amylocystis lapponica]|nr:cleft lip and palate associated transmembrane protein [Amylocystis lapponica]